MNLINLLKILVNLETPNDSFTVSKHDIDINDNEVFGISHINGDYHEFDELFSYEDILNWYESLPDKQLYDNCFVCFDGDGLIIENNVYNDKLISLHYATTDGVLEAGHPYFIMKEQEEMRLYWESNPEPDPDYDDYTQFKIQADSGNYLETFAIVGNIANHDEIIKFLSTTILKDQTTPENGTGLSFLIVTWAERMRNKGHYIDFSSLAELKEKLELSIYLTEQL